MSGDRKSGAAQDSVSAPSAAGALPTAAPAPVDPALYLRRLITGHGQDKSRYLPEGGVNTTDPGGEGAVRNPPPKTGGPTPPNPTTPPPGSGPGPLGNGTRKVDPFMPGQAQALADQLSQGFGGKPGEFLEAFKQVHYPMQIPNYEAGGGTGKGGEDDFSDVPTYPGDPRTREGKGPWKDGEWTDTRVPGEGLPPEGPPVRPPEGNLTLADILRMVRQNPDQFPDFRSYMDRLK